MLLSSGARFDAIVRAPYEFIQSLSLPGGWNMKLQNPHGDSWPKARTPAPLYWGSDVPPSPLNLLTARLRCSLPSRKTCLYSCTSHAHQPKRLQVGVLDSPNIAVSRTVGASATSAFRSFNCSCASVEKSATASFTSSSLGSSCLAST